MKAPTIKNTGDGSLCSADATRKTQRYVPCVSKGRFLRVLSVDLRKSLWNRWFVIALLASFFSLLLAITRDLSYLPTYMEMEYTEEPRWAEILTTASLGSFAALALPALSALPAAGLALLEIQSGAARAAVFRTGYFRYAISKAMACLLSGVLVQAGALLLLIALFNGFRLSSLHGLIPLAVWAPALPPLLARLLCGGLWAGAGSLIALLSMTASAASIGPLCLCYALIMVGTRFFPALPMINPVNWLQAPAPGLLLALPLLAAALAFVLIREVKAHV